MLFVRFVICVMVLLTELESKTIKQEISRENNVNVETVKCDPADCHRVLESLRQKRANIVSQISNKTGISTRWPNKTIPYMLSNVSMPTELVKGRLQKAMDHWEKFTCIRFEPYDPAKHKNFLSKVVVANRGTGCGADVGYFMNKRFIHNLFLVDDCSLTEFLMVLYINQGHVVGFRHEQNRIDRDSYVKLNSKILKLDPNHPDRTNYNIYNDLEKDSYGIPYDLSSIMHYTGKEITSLDPQRQFLMGQRKQLSFLDKQMANEAYKCSEHCQQKSACQNEGFMGQDCKCVCPLGLTGRFCEELVYNDKSDGDKIYWDNFKEGDLDCDFISESFCKWNVDKIRSITTEWLTSKSYNIGDELTTLDQIMSKKEPALDDLGRLEQPAKVIDGPYIYLFENSDENINSILTTPNIIFTKDSKAFLKFWFIMYEAPKLYKPSNGTYLSINKRFSNGSIEKLWHKEGNQGTTWNLVNLEINTDASELALFIQANVGDDPFSIIAIDALKIIKGIKEEWSEWSYWSRCIGLCHSAIRYRTRVCLNRLISPCTAVTNEYEECSNSCPKSKRNSEYISNFLIEKSENKVALTTRKPTLKPCGKSYDLMGSGTAFIPSPDYLDQYGRGLKCYYLIKANAGHKITATVNSLDIQQDNETGRCIDSLEFRYFHLGQPGPVFCGKKKRFKIETASNLMMIIFRSNWVQARNATGFLIKVSCNS